MLRGSATLLVLTLTAAWLVELALGKLTVLEGPALIELLILVELVISELIDPTGLTILLELDTRALLVLGLTLLVELDTCLVTTGLDLAKLEANSSVNIWMPRRRDVSEGSSGGKEDRGALNGFL